MTQQERIKYAEKYGRQVKKFEKQFTKPVYLALQSQIKDFVTVLKNDGLEAAKRRLFDIAINDRILPTVQHLYKTVGVFYANYEYGQLRKQVLNKKGFGFNAEWVAELISYFRMHLLSVVVQSISETTREQIRIVLEQATNEGWGIDQTARALQGSELTLFRARLIARTEIAKAAFKGREMGRDKLEYQTTNEWIAANDHRTRHSHRKVDGDVVEPGKSFKVPIYKNDLLIGYEQMISPGDPKATKGNVINCRCTSSARVKFDERGKPILK